MTEFKDIFGKPMEGVHKYRIGKNLFEKAPNGFASVDILLTLIMVVLISYGFKLNIILVLIVVLLLTVAIHKLIGVKTAFNSLLFD